MHCTSTCRHYCPLKRDDQQKWWPLSKNAIWDTFPILIKIKGSNQRVTSINLNLCWGLHIRMILSLKTWHSMLLKLKPKVNADWPKRLYQKMKFQKPWSQNRPDNTHINLNPLLSMALSEKAEWRFRRESDKREWRRFFDLRNCDEHAKMYAQRILRIAPAQQLYGNQRKTATCTAAVEAMPRGSQSYPLLVLLSDPRPNNLDTITDTNFRLARRLNLHT
jgi:hypothetical protein